MKTLITTTLLLLAALASADSEMLHSSADISASTANGTPVQLQGEILQALGDDRYLLRDRDGRIEIELPGKLTAGRVLDPGTRLIISGQVEQTAAHPRVDADKLHSLKSAINPASSTISY
ncbi:NirD/YgiW/YdeI family stress tolerance protein [Alcanivorax sp. S6407]|uniref:NirD/YgiW/YdeI family stress tolerance protein n=1 Tax=Alcanivorax sp. S6407 TaxID=2926424 RepID=UPI001FF503CD|nr:NirD/YgiW/YdeI family stress tolerance protein [Alcanivorax sp. S6407]MCK0154080.1 NirD/YgiW/YdeI family stress tolerance protein [Alcanivorax sp. S6407]